MRSRSLRLTIAWPVMRRAVVRIGEALASSGILSRADDVFFLTHDEVLAALAGAGPAMREDVAVRRSTREEQARLVPPLTVGPLNPMLARLIDGMAGVLGCRTIGLGPRLGHARVARSCQRRGPRDPRASSSSTSSSPARSSSRRSPRRPGRPCSPRAAAVVTDVGSAASHASIIAREYGIPAVVGCGDATARLANGMRVTVDGSTGNVEAAVGESNA